MFLIAGGLGRVGDIIRSRIEILQSASLSFSAFHLDQVTPVADLEGQYIA